MQSLKKLFKNRFAKNIAIIAGGTAFAQMLSMILSPIITRIYLPEEYGVLTVYAATLGLLSISSSLDYQKAIPIADEDDKAMNLLVLSIIILTIFVIITILLLIFWREGILELMDSKILSNYKFLIPLGVFL